ncbi:MAG: RidA family protein [Acidobacteriota bacterium]
MSSSLPDIQCLSTDRAPGAAGHYSQAVVHGGLVYVAGQLPRVPGETAIRIDSIEEQTRQVLKNVEEILLAAGSGLDRVLRMTVYISDIGLWSRVDAVYAEVMGEWRPARTVVPANTLHHGFQIEIDAIAAL